MSTPAPPVPLAASVLLARGPGSSEVFVVRRTGKLRFMGGFQAFPGGRVSPSDGDQRVAAVRELFEETGVLLARRDDDSFPADAELTNPRCELLADPEAFPVLLERLGLSIRQSDLTYIASLVTPPFSSLRFDTAFFTADMPPGQIATVEPGELDAGEWLSAEAALCAWNQGEALISPPTLSLLEAIRGRPVAEAARNGKPLFDALTAGAPEVIYFSPHVQMIPLFCDGLPPTYYTNAFLVGHDPAYLIDPGPADPDEQSRLFMLLDARLKGGARLAGVLLTHHHPDHVGAAEAVGRKYGTPILAHPWTARALADKVKVDHEITDGKDLELGVAPHGRAWKLEAIHAPGHAPGHLCFYEATYRLLFVGDMASTMSSVVITPPEGDIPDYLESLQRLRTLPARLLLPAHGSVSARPHFVLDECVNHRRKREEQLIQALTAGPRRATDLAQDLYRGALPEVMPYAEKQVLAGLLKLGREGRAEKASDETGPLWRLTTKTDG